MTGRTRFRLSTISILLVASFLGIAAAWTANALMHGQQIPIERADAFRQPEPQQAVVPAPDPVAHSASGQLAGRQPPDLKAVIGNITNWLVGMLVAVATLFLTIGGIRYLFAGGDPGEVAKAKDTLKYAGIGYCIAVLAPVLVKILQGFVGAS